MKTILGLILCLSVPLRADIIWFTPQQKGVTIGRLEWKSPEPPTSIIISLSLEDTEYAEEVLFHSKSPGEPMRFLGKVRGAGTLEVPENVLSEIYFAPDTVFWATARVSPSVDVSVTLRVTTPDDELMWQQTALVRRLQPALSLTKRDTQLVLSARGGLPWQKYIFLKSADFITWKEERRFSSYSGDGEITLYGSLTNGCFFRVVPAP